MAQEALLVPPIGAPCGACMYLRKMCGEECIFASYFNSDTGVDKFAVVHKVFGVGNVTKLLVDIPTNYRNICMETLSYEAEARQSNPIYGCVSTIKALQQQVATLQAELTMVQSQLVNTEFNHGFTTNLMNMSNFNHGFDLPMEPLQNYRFSQYEHDD